MAKKNCLKLLKEVNDNSQKSNTVSLIPGLKILVGIGKL